LQIGAAALQSVFVAHCEHCAVSVSQIGWAGEQLVLARHPTQALVVGSQTGASPGHWALLVHAVWHCPSAGKHAWPTAQSVAVRHATHTPEVQNGWFGEQSVFVAQSPQPMPGKQPCVHGTPLIEQAPESAALLQAATSTAAPATAIAPRKKALVRESQRSEDECAAGSGRRVVTASLQKSQDVR